MGKYALSSSSFHAGKQGRPPRASAALGRRPWASGTAGVRGEKGGRRGRLIPSLDLGKWWPVGAVPRRRVAVGGGELGGGATERGGGREVRGKRRGD